MTEDLLKMHSMENGGYHVVWLQVPSYVDEYNTKKE